MCRRSRAPPACRRASCAGVTSARGRGDMHARDTSVLVTGGAGFIGSELVAQLVRDGRYVIVLDNLVSGRRENLAGLTTASYTLVVGDIRDTELLAALLPTVSMVFHLACL